MWAIVPVEMRAQAQTKRNVCACLGILFLNLVVFGSVFPVLNLALRMATSVGYQAVVVTGMIILNTYVAFCAEA